MGFKVNIKNNIFLQEKKISTKPIEIRADYVYPKMKGSTIKQLDDEKFILSKSSFNWIEFIIGWALFIVPIYGIIDSYKSAKRDFEDIKQKLEWPVSELSRKDQFEVYSFKKSGEKAYWKDMKNRYDHVPFLNFCMILIALMGAGFIYLSFPRRKRFIFDRLNGTLTMPEFLGWRERTIPFDEAQFIYAKLGPRIQENYHLAILHSNGLTRSIIDFDFPQRFLSLYVWYMDRNRPLPLGSAFDAYRDKDYLRRYAEGFPPPLYPSSIDIPEYPYEGELPTDRDFFATDEAYERFQEEDRLIREAAARKERQREWNRRLEDRPGKQKKQ